MLELFFIKALLGGIGLAAIAGPLGCFIVWRRMAYFGDALSHSALLGIALGLAFSISINLSVIIIGLLFALAIVFMQRRGVLATDTILGILSHSGLAFGLLAISLLATVRVDLYAYLFGDILSMNTQDLWLIYIGGMAILIALYYLWSKLLLFTLHEELAKAEGVNVLLINLSFMFMIALVVAMAIHIVGVLLITSLLVIPAAAARQLANSPKQMVIIASLIGIMAVIMGLFASLYIDLPTGPAIVASTSLLFVLSLLRNFFVTR